MHSSSYIRALRYLLIDLIMQTSMLNWFGPHCIQHDNNLHTGAYMPIYDDRYVRS